jgi:hypothetical protein
MYSRLIGVTQDKKLTKITLITLPYFFTLRFSTLVVGPGVMETAVETTPHIPVTLRAHLMPPYHPPQIQLVPTKVTHH